MRLLLFLFLATGPLLAEPLILPTPQKIQAQRGEFTLGSGTRILFDTREAPRGIETTLKNHADVFAGEIELLTGTRPPVKALAKHQAEPNDIVLRFQAPSQPFAKDETEENHSYALHVHPHGVLIEASYAKGIAHGTASFLQLLKNGKAPACKITDSPEAAYRGVMIDVARHPHSIGVLKDVIRLARLYKLRYVHLHLTDDQSFTFPFEPVTSKLEKNNVYAREELVDLVAYADARGITLIPELDLPGHSSMLMKANYLAPNKNHADVADPANYEKIFAIIDDMLSVFTTSPYFHIGGDESGAGSKLVPFLEAVNKHVRSKDKRLLVWEGFHGAPTKALPATGDDRIIVMAWESTYNAPWDLLKNQYQIINSSWKPTYIVGGGGHAYPHNTGGRKWSPETLYRWDKNHFMHWETGRPIYHDRGPNDPNKDDGEWNASWIKKTDQILGGQMQFWEQRETAVLRLLPKRLATAASRLWNPTDAPFSDFQTRLDAVHETVMTIVQPVRIEAAETSSPITDFYMPYEGESMNLTLVNRTKIPGKIHYTEGAFSQTYDRIGFSEPAAPTPQSTSYSDPVKKSGGFSIRASLFREDGTPVEGTTWQYFNNWPNIVHVKTYDIGRSTPKEVIDLTTLPAKSSYDSPLLRGPINHTAIQGQMLTTVFTAPETGTYTFFMSSQSGRASLYLDRNQNSIWDEGERIITNSPTSEERLSAEVELTQGQTYLLRADHMTGMPRPVLGISMKLPGQEKRIGLIPYLSLPTQTK